MNTLLGLALALPLLGAALTVMDDRTSWPQAREVVGPGSAAVSAVTWATIAAADTPPELGRIEVHPPAAAAIAGLALLLAALLPRSALAASSSLCGITVFAVASTTGAGADRPLAVGVAVLVLLWALRQRAERAPRLAVFALPAAGLLIAAGLLYADAGFGAVLVIVGTCLCVATAAVSGPALLLVPVVIYATARAAEAAHASRLAGDLDADAVAVSGALAALVAALAVHQVGRPRRVRGGDGAHDRVVAVAAVLAAVVLMSQDLPALRSAGLLLAAGAVIASATTRSAGLVACGPGLVAAVEAFGLASDPVHAAAGATAVVILGGTVLLAPSPAVAAPWARTDWPVMVAAAFAVVPLWGWTGVEPPAYTASVTTGAAAASVAVLALVLAGMVPPGVGPPLGRLRSRPRAAIHASTYPRAEEVDPGEVPQGPAPDVEVPEAGRGASTSPPAGREDGAEEHPVAQSPGAVPRRAVRGGVDRRIRVRRRPGRPPG